MHHIFTPIDIEGTLDSLRFIASTARMAYHDAEIARFVERAVAHELSPTVLEVPGRVFPRFVPEALWDAPMWVHWLGDGYDDVMDELVDARIRESDHYSTDLLKRRQVLCWNTATHSFCTSPNGLRRSLHCAMDNEALSVFISPNRFVSNPAWVSGDLMDYLMVMDHHTGAQYRPHDQHTREELEAALVSSVLLGNEPKVDEDGRQIVMLKTRTLPQDWLA